MKENLPCYVRVTSVVVRLTLCGFLQIAPRRLVERFGPPDPGSADSKVTGTYHFQDDQQRVVQIYDWKATTLYDARPDAGHLSVAAFWASDLPQEFSVATATHVNLPAFAQWLEATSFREVRI